MISTIDKPELLKRISDMADKHLLVIGDLMLDRFIWGDVERISPEAPVPVVKVKGESSRLGGAGNVAKNVHALGGKVSLVSVIGNDLASKELDELLNQEGIDATGILQKEKGKTIVKTRIIAHSQQVVRIDHENSEKISRSFAEKLLHNISERLDGVQGVILSDYDKGVVTPRFTQRLREVLKKYRIPICIDPKVTNVRCYRGLGLLTPNHHEAAQMIGKQSRNETKEVVKVGTLLKKKLQVSSLLITRGEEGMSLFLASDKIIHIPTTARQVFDVTGAGDTVIATLTLALSTGADLLEASVLANYAAGVAVGIIGTAACTQQQLREAVKIGFTKS